MTKIVIMNELSILLRSRRVLLGRKVSEMAKNSAIDQALISKYENGSRMPSEKQLGVLSETYELEYKTVKKSWLVSKVMDILKYEDYAMEVLAVAEDRIEYLRSDKSVDAPQVSSELKDKLTIIDDLHQKWKVKKPLNKTQLSKLKDYFKIQYTYDSNKIEGNTLTYQETMLVVSEGITISGKSMKEHLEAINHAEAIDFLAGLVSGKEELSKRTLSELHSLVLNSIDKKNAGRYRSVPVRISGSEHVPPQPFEIEKLMENYFQFYENNNHKLHPVIMAADLHERLVSIHPFIDGNGRTSRLIMNFFLLKSGLTITSLKGDANAKLTYYQALESCRSEEGKESFYNLIADNVIRSLNEHLSMV